MNKTESKAVGLIRGLVFLGLALSLLSGCTMLSRKPAVPSEIHSQAHLDGMPGVRYSVASQSGINTMLHDISEQTKTSMVNRDKIYYLSLSGGGDNGAFGAGLLTGWSERGDRPRFDLVTGVSTGSLIAPFAYLGSDYDYVLRRVYTQVDQDNIFLDRGLVGGLFADAFSDTTPLYKLISEYVDAALLKKIAYEYNVNNRWLIVATTNLDAGVPVLWNMGKLASIGTPQSLELFRKILLASAAIPGAFPPVMIDVTANGKMYQEMHVDGGATTEVFLYPAALGAEALRQGVLDPTKKREAYIIRNARVDSDWREIERDTFSILGRAVDQLIQSQGQGDLQRIYLTANRDHVGFNLAYIGPDFKEPHVEQFDRKYMNALYQYAYKLGLAGYPWMKTPPGYDEPLNTDVKKQVQRQNEVLKAFGKKTSGSAKPE